MGNAVGGGCFEPSAGLGAPTKRPTVAENALTGDPSSWNGQPVVSVEQISPEGHTIAFKQLVCNGSTTHKNARS